MLAHCVAIMAACLTVVLTVKAEELTDPPISQADREYWSFRPLVRPSVPAVQAGDAANPKNWF